MTDYKNKYSCPICEDHLVDTSNSEEGIPLGNDPGDYYDNGNYDEVD